MLDRQLWRAVPDEVANGFVIGLASHDDGLQAGDDRYDIAAKAADPAGDHELMAMLRSLLSERFKLTVHRETRELPKRRAEGDVFALAD